MQHNLMHTNSINVLFDGLREFGKPSASLISQCLGFAFDEHDTRQANPVVVTKLIEWIPLMGEQEQSMLSEVLLRKCAGSMQRCVEKVETTDRKHCFFTNWLCFSFAASSSFAARERSNVSWTFAYPVANGCHPSVQ